MRGNGWHRAGRRRGSVSVRRTLAAAPTAAAVSTAAPTAVIWPDAVAGPPAAVVGAIGFVVAHADTPAVVIPIAAGCDAAGRQGRGQADGEGERREADCRVAQGQGVHWLTALLSVSGHSSRPNGAPSGSATTAT